MPICLTDTQSPFDTATLICDACEVFAACYENEELLLDFMQKITDLVIEFSRVQLDLIGHELAAMPGHQYPSLPGAPGFSLSDDNLAVSSPPINRKIALPLYAKVRTDVNIERALVTLDELAHPDLRLVVELAYDPMNTERNYHLVRKRLASVYE